MRILLIGGGWSNEREVSLRGSEAIGQALKNLGHEQIFLDPALEFSNLLHKAGQCDFAFINLHGAPGEDGLIQAMLESIGCPYQGSGARASLLALNKACSKEIFRINKIPTPSWEFLPQPPPSHWRPRFGFPFFIKPNTGGSSLDVTLIQDRMQMEKIMERLFSQGDSVLIEEAVQGTEVTCAVLGNTPLPPILIKPAASALFFDYHSKYTPQAAEEICPAPISSELTEQIQEIALNTHKVLDLEGYSRTDFMLKQGEPYVLEVNTLPGMTQTSLLPQAAEVAGYSFQELIAELIRLGLEK